MMANSNRPQTLIVFATSERVDVYVNCITHAIENLHISRIEVVVIYDHGYMLDSDSAKYAARVHRLIIQQLEALALGQYLKAGSVPNDSNSEPLAEPKNGQCYSRVLDVLQQGTGSRAIPLVRLDEMLRQWTKDECSFDVTALKNNLLVDVFALLLSLSYSRIFSFDFIKKEAIGQAALFHCLRQGEDYVYRNLIDSAPVSLAMSRIRRWTVDFRLYTIAVIVMLAGSIALFFVVPPGWLISLIGLAGSIASIVALALPLMRNRLG
jgi:hypothetical protein